MARSAPRIAHELLVLLERIDDGKMPIAEICRRLKREAASRGLTQPSYERVRELVQLTRALKPRRGPSAIRIILETSGGYRGAADAMDNVGRVREDRR